MGSRRSWSRHWGVESCVKEPKNRGSQTTECLPMTPTARSGSTRLLRLVMTFKRRGGGAEALGGKVLWLGRLQVWDTRRMDDGCCTGCGHVVSASVVVGYEA